MRSRLHQLAVGPWRTVSEVSPCLPWFDHCWAKELLVQRHSACGLQCLEHRRHRLPTLVYLRHFLRGHTVIRHPSLVAPFFYLSQRVPGCSTPLLCVVAFQISLAHRAYGWPFPARALRWLPQLRGSATHCQKE